MNTSHERIETGTDVWLTPPEIIKSLGEFDLDPCSPLNRPWDTAKKHYTIDDDGLLQPWDGRVWMNPPYGNKLEMWLNKLSLHMNGIALTFARTDTAAFHNYVFSSADSILFIRNRLIFYDTYGKPGKSNAGAPSVLIAYGDHNVQALADSGIKGKHMLLNSVPMVVVSSSPAWKNVVTISLLRLGREASLKQIYDMVELIAPDKIEKNAHYKAKVRQVLQKGFARINKGEYRFTENVV